MREEVSEEKKQENRKIMTAYLSTITGIGAAYICGYIGSLMESMSLEMIPATGEAITQLSQLHLTYSLNLSAIIGMLCGVVVGFCTYFFESLHQERMSSYTPTKVAGSARFMTTNEIKQYEKEYIEPEPEDLSLPSPNMILSEKFRRPINSRALIGNNNVLIVGGAGTGKSRFFIKPNVLQMNASFVITDPSGEIIYSLGNALKNFGYKIKVFNISDMAHSNCYNPLQYIRDEAGVNMVIDCFIKNTTQGDSKGDEFFTNAEKLLYSACIFYLKDFCKDESRKNFASVVNMVNASAVTENNPMAKSDLDELFDNLPKDSLAWKYYKAFKQAADKTLKSIIISCLTRLQPFMTPQVANLTRTDNMELEKLGKEKTALFIITPQADRTYAFLASMLYSQLFETLYYIGEQQKAAGGSEQMDIPVRCLMDEFANIGEVPEFPSKLSTMRKYNISASIVLQDISQIESMYKDEWKTLVGNCSSIVFLGTQEPNTLKYFSEMLGKGTVKNKGRGISRGKMNGSNQSFQNSPRELMFPDELARMHSSKCIVFTQNMRAVRDKKFPYETHPRYKQTADYDNTLGFQYNTMSAYDNSHMNSLNSLLKAKAEAARAKRENLITDGKKLDKKTKTEFSKDDAMDMLEIPAEEPSFLEKVTECQKQWMDSEEDVAVAYVESVPKKKLIRILKQGRMNIPEKKLIVFTDLHLQNHSLIGATADASLYTIMDNDMIEKKEIYEEYQLVWVNQFFAEQYVEKIQNAISPKKSRKKKKNEPKDHENKITADAAIETMDFFEGTEESNVPLN